MNGIVRFFLDPNAFTLLDYQYILINASSLINSSSERHCQVYFFALQTNSFRVIRLVFDHGVWRSYKNTTIDIRSQSIIALYK